MKKIISILLMLLMLASCTPKNKSEKLNISVSFYPLSYFTQEIGQDKIDVFNVLDKGSDAHDYEPSIQDRVKIEDSDIFIHNGFHLEHWVDKTLDSINNDALLVVDSSDGITPIMREGHADPHIWLDPYCAETQIDNIYQAIIMKDKANEAYYKENYLNLKDRIQLLQNDFDEALNNVDDASLILEHEIFTYSASRYNFKQVSVSGIFPEGEPSFQQLKTVLDYIEDKKMEYLLLSKYNSSKVIDTISKSSNTKILLIDSMEIGNGTFDYFEIMHENLQSIKEALSHE